MQTDKAGVMSLSPACVTIINAIGKEGNGKPPYKSASLEKTQSRVSSFCYTGNHV